MRVEPMVGPSAAFPGGAGRIETQISDRLGLGGFSASGFGRMPTFASPSLADHYVARIEADNSAYTRLVRDTAVLNAAAEVADAAVGTAAGLHPWTSTAYNVGKVVTSQTDLERGVAMLDQGTGHIMQGLGLGSLWTGVGALRGLFKISQSLDTFHDTVNQSFSNTVPVDMVLKDPFLNTRVNGFTTSMYQSSGTVGYDPGVDRVRRQVISHYSTMDTFKGGVVPTSSTRLGSPPNWGHPAQRPEPVRMQNTPDVDHTYIRPSMQPDVPQTMTRPDLNAIQPVPASQPPIPPATTYQQPISLPAPARQPPIPPATTYQQPISLPQPPPPPSIPQPIPSFRTERIPPPSRSWP